MSKKGIPVVVDGKMGIGMGMLSTRAKVRFASLHEVWSCRTNVAGAGGRQLRERLRLRLELAATGFAIPTRQ